MIFTIWIGNNNFLINNIYFMKQLSNYQSPEYFSEKLQSIFYDVNPKIIQNFCDPNKKPVSELYRDDISSHKKINQFLSAMVDLYFDVDWSKYNEKGIKLYFLKLVEEIQKNYKRLSLSCIEIAFSDFKDYDSLKTYGRLPSIPYVRSILNQYVKLRSKVEKRYFDISVKTYTNSFDPEKQKKAKQEILMDYENLKSQFNLDVNRKKFIKRIPTYWKNTLIENGIIKINNDLLNDCFKEAVKLYRENLSYKIIFSIKDFNISTLKKRIELVDAGKYDDQNVKSEIDVIVDKLIIFKSML